MKIKKKIDQIKKRRKELKRYFQSSAVEEAYVEPKFYDEFTDEGILNQDLAEKIGAFYIFDDDYYWKRVMILEASIVDIIRRRMVPDAKRCISTRVNTYNTINADVLEWESLITKLCKSSEDYEVKEDDYKVRDRGAEAGTARRGKRIRVSWSNSEPNNHLPILNNDRYWWGFKWTHKEIIWRALVLKMDLVYKPESHKIRIEFEYGVWTWNDEGWMRRT